MSTQQQNRGKLRGLAASASQDSFGSSAAAIAEASTESPSRQGDSSAKPQIGRIAHDFNNILTLLLGYSESLLRTLPKGHPGRSFAEEICRAARDGEKLSLELASLAQSGSAHNSASATR
jgi:hypothetical protein